MTRTIKALFCLALIAVAGSALAAPVPATLIRHNWRSSGGTLITLQWAANCTPTTGGNCYDYGNAWTVANIDAGGSMAKWTWESVTGVLASTGVYIPAVFVSSNPAGTPVAADRVVDLSIDTVNQVTTASNYRCIDGTLAPTSYNACGDISFGFNASNDSTLAYNVGGDPYCVVRTLGGDDSVSADPLGVRTQAAGGGCDATRGRFLEYTVLQNSGGILVLSNGIPKTDPLAEWLTFALNTDAVIVSNLTETYDFGAGLSGAFVSSSSFTTDAHSYRLNSITLTLQMNVGGSIALSLFNDSGGVPGTAVENLGSQSVGAGQHDTVFPASGTTILQANTRYWLVVEQPGGGSSSWVSTYSTAETAPGGVTIGNDMYYRATAVTTWTPYPTATEAGHFAVNAAYGDLDADGVADASDTCPAVPNADQANSDADARGDACDNCKLVSNNAAGTVPHTASILLRQFDADADGYGNICDADINQSGATTASDYTLLRNVLSHFDDETTCTAPCIAGNIIKADMNGSGQVTTADYTLLRSRLSTGPAGLGPSGLACAGTVPCLPQD